MAKVLVVDDSASMRAILIALLEPDHDVIVGEDGIDAVWQYKRSQPDAVLMDLNMTVMNGMEALRRIKEIDPAARIAILTGERDQNTVISALSAGAIDYVGKPCTSKRISSAVKALLRD